MSIHFTRVLAIVIQMKLVTWKWEYRRERFLSSIQRYKLVRSGMVDVELVACTFCFCPPMSWTWFIHVGRGYGESSCWCQVIYKYSCIGGRHVSARVFVWTGTSWETEALEFFLGERERHLQKVNVTYETITIHQHHHMCTPLKVQSEMENNEKIMLISDYIV